MAGILGGVPFGWTRSAGRSVSLQKARFIQTVSAKLLSPAIIPFDYEWKKGGHYPPDLFTHFGGFPWFFKVWGSLFSLKGNFLHS